MHSLRIQGSPCSFIVKGGWKGACNMAVCEDNSCFIPGELNFYVLKEIHTVFCEISRIRFRLLGYLKNRVQCCSVFSCVSKIV